MPCRRMPNGMAWVGRGMVLDDDAPVSWPGACRSIRHELARRMPAGFRELTTGNVSVLASQMTGACRSDLGG